MLIRSRREFMKTALSSVGAIGALRFAGEIRRDECFGRHCKLKLQGAGLHLPRRRQ